MVSARPSRHYGTTERSDWFLGESFATESITTAERMGAVDAEEAVTDLRNSSG